MRLLTKDWYQTMEDSGLGVCLEIDKRAAVCSEETYQTIRAEKLENWLQEQRELSGMMEEVYDPEEARRSFAELVDLELQKYRCRMPPKILQKVADIRLLALGVCTEEVFADLREYRDRCRKWTEKTLEEAWNMRVSQGLEKAWTGEHSLHDSLVLEMRREGEDLLIEFERDENVDWPEIKAARFRDARILKRDQPMEHAWWLYDEIWSTEEGYEIHALLWRDQDVFELTVACREAELVWTVPPEEAKV